MASLADVSSCNPAFLLLLNSNTPTDQLDIFFPALHIYVNKLYGVSEVVPTSVGEDRMHQIVHEGKCFDNIPTSEDALQHNRKV